MSRVPLTSFSFLPNLSPRRSSFAFFGGNKVVCIIFMSSPIIVLLTSFDRSSILRVFFSVLCTRHIFLFCFHGYRTHYFKISTLASIDSEVGTTIASDATINTCVRILLILDLSHTTELLLTLSEPQSRFGDKPVKYKVDCPQNGTAVLKGLIPPRLISLIHRMCMSCLSHLV